MIARAGIIGATAFLIQNYTIEVGGGEAITIEAFGEVPAEARDALPF